MNHKIAILLTTFLRDELLYKTVQSILTYMSDDCILLIADQGKQLIEKEQFYQSLPKDKVRQWYLPFDCGLSYSRNFLVDKAKELNIPYCLLTADSIEFIQPIKELKIIIRFLEEHQHYGIVGMKLNNRVNWEKLIKLSSDKSRFVITNAYEYKRFMNTEFLRCDIVRNFFLAKTDALFFHKWDNNLKLAEHEDFFWRLKLTSFYKVFYNESYSANYINYKPHEYNIMRKRLYAEFMPLFLKKYNMKVWLQENK